MVLLGLFILNWNVNWILTVASGVRTGVEQARRPRGASGARISRFPANRRDIAVVVAENVPQRIFYPNVRKLA